MREPTFWIMVSLADGEKHGYAIMQDVAEQTDGRVQPVAGTLYPALSRLCGEGWVRETGTEIVDGRARHFYALTRLGVSALEDEVERMRRNATLAARRLREAGVPA